jgi:8-oxo-dGTP pyrophosphatase MutT (NUDIX family)
LLPELRALLDAHRPDGAGTTTPAVDGQTESAVLVPIYLADAEPHVVLTRRRADLRRHAGEVSFPGGRRDPEDATLAATALREAQEEIGLDPSAVSIAGQLTPTSTFVTNYAIHPFVGAIEAQTAWSVSAVEVDAVIELSLRALRLAHGTAQITRRGFTFETDAYELEGHMIWGATARILDELIARLSPMLD